MSKKTGLVLSLAALLASCNTQKPLNEELQDVRASASISNSFALELSEPGLWYLNCVNAFHAPDSVAWSIYGHSGSPFRSLIRSDDVLYNSTDGSLPPNERILELNPDSELVSFRCVAHASGMRSTSTYIAPEND